MIAEKHVKFYSDSEEKLNIWSHGLGIIGSIIGVVLLLIKSSTWLEYTSSIIFGGSMILLYSASTLYHSAKDPIKRTKLRILDHAAIYVQIAGTYTPFAIITLSGDIGTLVLLIIWALAVGGVILKLFFTGRFSKLSTVLYVLMGWIGIFAAKPIMEVLDHNGLMLVLWGGISYTIGAVLYAIKSLPYNHAIFHFFVLIGSLLHFLSIYWFVIGG